MKMIDGRDSYLHDERLVTGDAIATLDFGNCLKCGCDQLVAPVFTRLDADQRGDPKSDGTGFDRRSIAGDHSGCFELRDPFVNGR